MFKKTIIALLILIILLAGFIYSPASSYIIANFLEARLEEAAEAEIDFTGFKYRPFKQAAIEKLTFSKDRVGVEATGITAGILKANIFSGSYIIHVEADKIVADYNAGKLIPVIVVISDVETSPLPSKMVFDKADVLIIAADNEVEFKDIEAVGKDIKVYGNIKYKQPKTHYDLALYVPSESTEDLPDIAKAILNVKEEAGWSKFNINITTND